MRKKYGFLIGNDNGKKTIIPAYYNQETGRATPVNLPTDIQRSFKNWERDLVSYDEIKNRFERYSDLEFMSLNSGIMFLAIMITSQETVVPSENNRIIEVKAKNAKTEKYIYDFLAKIGVTRQILEAMAYDLTIYGDHFWLTNIDSKLGVTEIVPIEVYDIEDRIEFSASKEAMEASLSTYRRQPSNSGVFMADLVDALSQDINSSDYVAAFKKYTFGFKLKSSILPPWAVCHFRRFNLKNEFAPFGKPQFIHSLSLYRQLKSGQNLLNMARVAKFPKELFNITAGENMTPAQKWSLVNEVRQNYYNLVSSQNGKEENSIGGSIWTVEGLLEYSIIENNLDLGNISDIEMLETDLITSTGIPKDYLIQNSSTWGSTDRQLLQQSKIFARNIYVNQTAILEEVSNLIRLHLSITGDLEAENTEFELSLSYPVVEETNDNLDLRTKTMEFANSIIDNLKTALGVDEIPKDVSIEIFKKYSFLDSEDIEEWSKTIEDSNTFEESKLRKIRDGLDEELIKIAEFEAKKKLRIPEGTYRGRHFIMNTSSTKYQEAIFKTLKKMKETKLEE